MKQRKIIPLTRRLTKIDEWRNNERVFRRSLSKKRLYRAWLLASQWIGFLNNCKARKLTPDEKRSDREFLTFQIAGEIFNSIQKRDGKFFQDFGHFLEIGAEPDSRVRLWLAEKHHIADDHGKPMRYTHNELLDDAERKGITIDERQLRRLMKESGFSFKNSK